MGAGMITEKEKERVKGQKMQKERDDDRVIKDRDKKIDGLMDEVVKKMGGKICR